MQRGLPATATLLTLSALLCGSPRLAAQAPDTTLGDLLLVRKAFDPGGQDSVEVMLTRHGQYRLLLSSPVHSVRIRPAKGRAAFVAPVGRSGDQVVLEVHPYQSGSHIVTLLGPPQPDSVVLWLWADRKKEEQALASLERRWGIGPHVGVGMFSGYRLQGTDPKLQRRWNIEGGLLIGNSGRFGALLGVDFHDRPPGAQDVAWFFIEPRYRMFRRGDRGQPLDLDLAVRLGQGNVSGLGLDPNLVAGKVMVSWPLDHRPGNRGWRMGIETSFGLIGNISYRENRTTMHAGLSLSWLP